MEILKPKKYLTVVKIPLSELAKVDLIMGDGKTETMSHCYNRLPSKPNFLINGGLYVVSSGQTITTVVDEGKQIGTGYGKDFGLSIYKDLTLKFEPYKFTSNLKDYMGACPSLVVNGVKKINARGLDSGFINGRHPRSAVGMNKDYFYIISVDGRNLLKGLIGMTLNELADYAIKELHIDNLLNLDGGGSQRLMHGSSVINVPTENRPVDNFLAFYLKAIVVPNPTPTIPSVAKKDIRKVKQDLNIRNKGSLLGKKVGIYTENTLIEVLEIQGKWARTNKGFISLSYLVKV